MSDVSSSPGRSFNWRHLVGLLALFAVVAGGVYVVVREQGGDAVIARVGSEELTEDQLFAIVGSNDPLVDNERFDVSAASEVLSNWMIVEAVVQELEGLGASVSDDAVAEAEAALLDRGVDVTAAPGAFTLRSDSVVRSLRVYAEANATVEVAAPEFLCASHLLVETEEQAFAAMARAEAGEEFGALAIELSTDPSAAGNGGDLGCNPSELFVPEFTEGARSADGAGLVGPVRTDFGFHIIDVRSIGPLNTETHPEISEAVIATTIEGAELDARTAVVSEMFNQVVVDAQVRIAVDGFLDPRYGAWDPTAGIVPPDGVTG